MGQTGKGAVMKQSMIHDLRIREITTRLNELAGKETLTAEERAETETLSGELGTRQAQYRAAVQAEDAESREHRRASDGEGTEQRALIGNIRLGRYLQAAVESRAVDGRESELNASFGLGNHGVLPWAALDPVEARADVATDGIGAMGRQTNQDAILARVFANSVTAFLRVATPSVGVGAASYPVFTGGASGAFVAEGVAQDAEAATFEARVCVPHRVTARYLWRIEDTATLAGMESALREDLSMVMTDRIDVQILAGDGTGANLSGFFDPSAGPIDAPADATAAAAEFDDVTKVARDQVDGLYASSESSLRLVVGPAWYQHAGAKYRATDGDVNAND